MPANEVPSVVLTNVKLVPLRVAAFIASLKVAVTAVLLATPVAPEAGTVTVTVGRVVSGAAPVVKLQTWLPAAGATAVLPARALPDKSVAALVMVAVKRLLAARPPGLDGVKVAVRAPTA